VKPLLPLEVEGRLARLEARLGRRIRVRLARWQDEGLRGRLREDGCDLVLECNDVNPGFFWHVDVVRELLDRVEAGEIEAEVH